MKDFTNQDLIIEIKEENGVVSMNWLGNSISRKPSTELIPYFDQIMEKTHNKKLKIDFRNLDLLNSSSVPPIIQFIKRLEDNKILTEIIYKEDLEWQKKSFKALKNITKKFIHVKIIGK